MSTIDWIIALVPFFSVLALAIWAKRYVRDIVDFLAAGRVAGRYVISVGDVASALSVITLVASVESQYRTGFAMGFWNIITIPVGMIFALTGYCTYRYRATKALSVGQFLEQRYSHRFRIFAASLRTIAEMITNAIGPAIAANFFIYFLGLPHRITICGVNLPCFAIIVALCLTLAMIVLWPAGRISLLITDTFQGLISYPIFVIISGYIILHYSWDVDVIPVMQDRVAGESYLNPFDISKLRDFNFFGLIVSIMSGILNRASWFGNDTSNCGRTPHEQKMAGVLGTWRAGFSWIMIGLISILVITVMNNDKFVEKGDASKISSHQIRVELIDKVAGEAIVDEAVRAQVRDDAHTMAPIHHTVGVDAPFSRGVNFDSHYIDQVSDRVNASLPANLAAEAAALDEARARGEVVHPSQELTDAQGQNRKQIQKFRTLYGQMMMPVVLRNILPTGVLGLFALLMIMLLVSTDDSRIFNASSTLVQDVVIPFCKKPPTMKQHLLWLRLVSLGVAIFFFVVGCFFSQLDYINMFTTIMCALWTGGAGPVMVFGLYSRFGNKYGAWASLYLGGGTSLLGLIIQRNWADSVIPFLQRHNAVEAVRGALAAISRPFNPWIDWNVAIDKTELLTRGNDAFCSIDSFFLEKFPINSTEISFIAMVLSLAGYIGLSLLAIKLGWAKPFNLDKMLHRGEYAEHNEADERAAHAKRPSIIQRLVGVTREYTLGDRCIAWSVFIYTVGYKVLGCFVFVYIWNKVSPWPAAWWGNYYFLTSLIIPTIIGLFTTVWFMWGGITDTIRLFKDLGARTSDEADNGWIKH